MAIKLTVSKKEIEMEEEFNRVINFNKNENCFYRLSIQTLMRNWCRIQLFVKN
jgi:hypothetical protein